MASLGLYSLVATLLWGWLLFGITVPVASPLLFVLSIVVSIFSIALLGFLLSVAVVRYRTAWAMGNLLEYPGWLLCGFLVPLTLFPAWVGLDRLRAAADLGHAGDPRGRRRASRRGWTSLMCLGRRPRLRRRRRRCCPRRCCAPPVATRRCR